MEISESNITQIIMQTINTLFENLFSSIDNSIYAILDDITFIDISILHDSYFDKIFGTSTSNGILLIANSLLLGFLIYYSVHFAISYFTSSQIERPYQFIFKILLAGIFMNCSLFLCEKIIDLNSNISLAVRNIGEELYNKNICFSGLNTELNLVLNSNDSFNIFSLDGIIKSLSSVGLFNLIFSYSLRYIMIKVFVLISPFAFLCLCTNKSNWFFKTWLRGFISLLFLQILISLILLISFSINFNSEIFSKFMYIGCIYALIKANFYINSIIRWHFY